MRNYNLDILRIIFALLVVIMHINVESTLKHFSIISNAYIFVDFFFVLSAFVLYLSYIRDGSNVYKLILKRVKRLVPLHLFILLLFFIFELIKFFVIEKHFHFNTNAFHDETSIAAFFTSVALLDSFNIFPHNIWNAPAWSISAELYAYICLVLLSKFSYRVKQFLFAILLVFIILFVFNRGTLDYGSNFGIFRCLYSYIIVVLFFNFRLTRIINLITFLLSLTLVIVYFLFAKDLIQFEYLLPIAFTFIVFFIYYKLPSYKYNKYLIKLADLSFEVYLIQALIIVLFSDLFIVLKNKFNFIYNIDESGLVVFKNSNIALFATIIIVVIIVFTAVVISKILFKIQQKFA